MLTTKIKNDTAGTMIYHGHQMNALPDTIVFPNMSKMANPTALKMKKRCKYRSFLEKNV